MSENTAYTGKGVLHSYTLPVWGLPWFGVVLIAFHWTVDILLQLAFYCSNPSLYCRSIRAESIQINLNLKDFIYNKLFYQIKSGLIVNQ